MFWFHMIVGIAIAYIGFVGAVLIGEGIATIIDNLYISKKG